MKLSTLTKFLDRLDEEEIPYTLASVREGTVTVSVTVPDERWEVEFTAEGDVEIEVVDNNPGLLTFAIAAA